MAMTEQQANEIINLLRAAVQGGSVGSGVSSDDVKKLNKTIKGMTKEAALQRANDKMVQAAKEKMSRTSDTLSKSYISNLTQFSKNMGVQFQLVSDALDESTSKLRHENLELLPKAFQHQFHNSMNHTMVQMGKQLNSLADFEKVNSDFKELANINARLKEGVIDEAEALEDANKILKVYNAEVRDATRIRATLNDTVEKSIGVYAKVAREASGGGLGELVNKGKKAANAVGMFAGAATAVSDQLMDIAQPAMRYGTYITDSFDAFRAGMNPEEFAAVQAQYRQQIGAAGISLDTFQDTVISGASSLTAYTGDLKDAVRMQADAFALARTYGIQGEQATQQFIQRQGRLFKEFNSVFSMTAEEFVQMNEQIRNSTAVQERIYRLNRQQRQLYIEQYQQTVRQLKINGLSQEAAMAAADAMAALGAESPKERLKKAAKLQAVGGALGFGGEAARAAEMMRRGNTATPEFAELMKTMEQQTGQVMGRGFGSEMMVSQMLETTGLQNMLGPKSDFAKLNTRQYDKIEDLSRSATKREEYMGDVVTGMNQLNSFFTGSWGKTMGSISAGVGMIVSAMAAKGALTGLAGGGSIKDILGKQVLGKGGVLAQGAGLFGKLASKALVGGAVVGVGAIGWEIGSFISDSIEKHIPEVKDAIGAGITKTLAFFGSDNAQATIAANKRVRADEIARQAAPRERREKANSIESMIQHLRETQEKVRAQTHETAKEEAAAFDNLIKIQQEQLEKLNQQIELDKKNVQATETQTEKQKEQHDETMKRSKKNSRLIWTQVAG